MQNALPFEQDATLIISSLNTAALRTGVDIVGYSVSPGRIYEKTEEEKTEEVTQKPKDTTPFQELDLRISTDSIQDLVAFTSTVEKLIPISEVKEFSAQGGEGSYNLKFFYKPLNRQAISEKDIITPLKTSDLELIEDLKSLSL